MEKKTVILVGTGCGTMSTITAEGYSAITHSDLLIGAERLLGDVMEWAGMPQHAPRTVAAIYPEDIIATINAALEKHICVLFSGDTGFYSGTKKLVPKLKENGVRYVICPGISSVQALSAALGEPWQDWKLVSAHGVDIDPVKELMEGRKVFFLTGGDLGPSELCRRIAEAGIGGTEVVIGERLTYPDERIRVMTAAKAAGTEGEPEDPIAKFYGDGKESEEMEFDKLSVVLAGPSESVKQSGFGVSDEQFVRGSVPLTKKDVRSAILGRLSPGREDTIWDVGAGTGGVSVEMALAAPYGKVYAIERNPEGIELIEENRRNFGVWNLCPIRGEAPDALETLPAPDKVFVGGSGGELSEIIDIVLEKNEKARICVTAILIETLADAVRSMEERGLVTEVCQITSAAARKVGSKHMMIGENPIYIILGEKVEKRETEAPER